MLPALWLPENNNSPGTAPILVEDKTKLLRIRPEIPLGESQIVALENLPTLVGPTPSSASRRVSRADSTCAERQLKYKNERAPALDRGPIFSVSQSGDAPDPLAASSGTTEPKACTSGSGSPRSSLRTRSAWIDQDVILVVADFLPLSFWRS
jgi:hypothetical protein